MITRKEFGKEIGLGILATLGLGYSREKTQASTKDEKFSQERYKEFQKAVDKAEEGGCLAGTSKEEIEQRAQEYAREDSNITRDRSY